MSLDKLLKDGAIAMAANKFEDACGIYSEACQMANLEQGKDDPDLMYLYGKALFENAVQSSDVLGVGKEKAKREVEEKKEDEEEEDGQFQFNNKLAEEEDDEEEEEVPAAEASDSSDEGVEAPEEGEEGENGEEGEQSDFEIAWEILDLTRLLYVDQLAEMAPVAEPYHDHIDEGTDFVNKYTRLCDVYMLIGDISLENENFPQAVEDYEKGNDMLKKVFDASNGRRHEAMFKLSLAYEFVGDDAGLAKSISCMKEVLAMVAAGKDADLVEEVKNRVHDLQVLQKQRAAEKEQLLGLLQGVAAPAVDAAAARDLSGLVKKKKKVKGPGRVSK